MSIMGSARRPGTARRAFLGGVAGAVTTAALGVSGRADAAGTGDDYPAYLRNAAMDSIVDPWSFYNRECTSFAAWRLNQQGGHSSAPWSFLNNMRGPNGASVHFGNAYQWLAAAQAGGWAANGSPAVGAVAWWGQSSSSSAGHVAIVTAVNGDGSVNVEEYNYNYTGTYHTRSSVRAAAYLHIADSTAQQLIDGVFVQVSGSSAIYRIAGGAPMYVSSWSAVGGPQPYTVISQAQFDALNPVPRDGTFIADNGDGRVYEIAGGAPMYVSAGDAARVPGWGSRPVIGIDHYDLANLDHLRQYPADGTFISNVDDGRCYVVAGGAPLYISASDAPKVPGWGSKSVTVLSGYEFTAYQHLRKYPADGTFISNVDDGRVYEVAGGAPLYISATDAAKVPGWGSRAVTGVSGYEFTAYQHLRKYPANGTLIGNVGDGTAYVVAGGAPIAITGANAHTIPGWGTQPVTVTSSYEFTAHQHLLARPANGTALTAAGKHYVTWSGAAYVAAGSGGTVIDPVAVGRAGGTGVWSHLAAIPAIGLTVPTSSTPANTTSRITVSWSVGAAPLKATVRYTVERRTVTVSAAGTRIYSTPTNWLSNTTATTANFNSANGTETQFRVQAVDALGNRSAWSAWKTSTMPIDDRSGALVFSSGWTRGTSSHYFNGTYSATAKSGATVHATFWASSISVVGTRAASTGSFAIYVDGVKRATVDSHASSTKYRQTLATVKVPYGRHTIKLVNLATAGHARFYLDALVITR